MNLTEAARAYHEKMFPGAESPLWKTDPEWIERFENFAFDEVVNEEGQQLDDKTRFMAILASLLGCQAIDVYRVMLPAAMNFGVTPVEIKEITYQAVDYLGIGRVLPFLNAANEIFEKLGIRLPLEGQATTTTASRYEAGERTQIEIFGEGMKDFGKKGHIRKWLVDNCFGDYYTRKGLDLKQREMITFCFLSAQGGCEPQLTSHAAGNMRLGNDKAFLIRVISQCLPYIGYPRSLNALRCVRAAEEQAEK